MAIFALHLSRCAVAAAVGYTSGYDSLSERSLSLHEAVVDMAKLGQLAILSITIIHGITCVFPIWTFNHPI